jgi:hypothetical protein
MPIRPADRTPSMKSLTNFVPSEFDVSARFVTPFKDSYQKVI